MIKIILKFIGINIILFLIFFSLGGVWSFFSYTPTRGNAVQPNRQMPSIPVPSQ